MWCAANSALRAASSGSASDHHERGRTACFCVLAGLKQLQIREEIVLIDEVVDAVLRNARLQKPRPGETALREDVVNVVGRLLDVSAGIEQGQDREGFRSVRSLSQILDLFGFEPE